MTGGITTCAYAARSEKSGFAPYKYETKKMEDGDVHIKVKFCGLCHSDVHQVRSEWGPATYPIVPGHEVVGVVEAVGSKVNKFKKGDKVGVGCLVDSCLSCPPCKDNEEMYCQKGFVPTYNGKFPDGTVTYGGYGSDIVVREEFVCRWPDNLPQDTGAPLLCAGITTYQPLVRFGCDKGGKTVVVIGCGGLGHIGIMIAVAMGNKVVVVSRSESKKEDALKNMNASDFITLNDADAVAKYKGSADLILDTVGLRTGLDKVFPLLTLSGVYCNLGMQPGNVEIAPMSMLRTKQSYTLSLIGGLKRTQEMLDFCAAKNILPIVEKIKPQELDEAYKKVVDSKVRYRYVIDVGGSNPKVEDLGEETRK